MNNLQTGEIARTLQLVNIRREAGLSAPILGTLPPNLEIQLQSTAQADGLTWWKFTRGWVAQAAPDGTELLEDATPLSIFDKALRFTLRWEGGLSLDQADAGNWTGGRQGVGELKGTKKGISAASYPTLDIANLTDEQIAGIYRVDYWAANGCDSYAFPLALMHFDTAVNMGSGAATKLMGQSNGNYLAYAAQRLTLYTTFAQFDRYGGAWIRRVADALELISYGIQV